MGGAEAIQQVANHSASRRSRSSRSRSRSRSCSPQPELQRSHSRSRSRSQSGRPYVCWRWVLQHTKMVTATLYRSILRAAARLKDPRTGLIQFTEPVNARMWGHGPPPPPPIPAPLEGDSRGLQKRWHGLLSTGPDTCRALQGAISRGRRSPRSCTFAFRAASVRRPRLSSTRSATLRRATAASARRRCAGCSAHASCGQRRRRPMGRGRCSRTGFSCCGCLRSNSGCRRAARCACRVGCASSATARWPSRLRRATRARTPLLTGATPRRCQYVRVG